MISSDLKEEVYTFMFLLLKHFGEINEELTLAIKDRTNVKKILKNKVMINDREADTPCYFIFSGYVAGIITEDGKKSVEWFMGPKDIIIRPESFHKNVLSKGSVIVLQNTIAVELLYKDFVWLKDNFPAFRDIYEKALGHYYELSLEREKMKRNTGEVNLANLLKDYPNIFDIAGVENVASYLGITREQLTRIRKNS